MRVIWKWIYERLWSSCDWVYWNKLREPQGAQPNYVVTFNAMGAAVTFPSIDIPNIGAINIAKVDATKEGE